MNSVEVAQTLFSGSTLKFSYNSSTKDYNSVQLGKKLQDFSATKNISIMKYNFVSDSELNMYATNISSNENIKLKSGVLPSQNKFVSNKKTGDKNQVGVMYCPYTEWTICVYDFSQSVNVGTIGEFYISNDSKEMLHAIQQTFDGYGLQIESDTPLNLNMLVNRSLFMMVLLSFFVCTIGIMFFGAISREKIYLQELWGYSRVRICLFLVKDFIHPFIYCELFLSVCFFSLNFYAQGSVDWLRYALYFLVGNMCIGVLFMLLFFCSSLLVFVSQCIIKKKQKASMKILNDVTIIMNALIIVLLFSIVCSSVTDMEQIRDHVNSLSYWDKAKNIYKICYNELNSDVWNNFDLGRELNDRMENFYELLDQKKQGILMDSQNFQNMGHEGGKTLYSCELDIADKSMLAYSPHGKSLTINTNYLRKNPIKDINGRIIDANLLAYDENILNLLVPEQFQSNEELIKKNYLDYFYFQKVDVDNIYNGELKLPLNKQVKDSLSIHIIYTKPNQTYFTYNPDTGDQHNEIIDPIAMVYTNGSMDTSHIMAMVTSSLFVESNAKSFAYNDILPIIEDAHTPEITQVLSVYGQANDRIVQERSQLFQQGIALLIIFLFTMILLLICIGVYFYSNVYKMAVMYLFGYSYRRRNICLIAVICSIGVVSAAISYSLYHSSISWFVLAVYLISEFAILKLVGDYLNRNNINKISNGEMQ